MKQIIRFRIPDHASFRKNTYFCSWWKALEGDIALLTTEEHGPLRVEITQDTLDKINLVQTLNGNSPSTIETVRGWNWCGYEGCFYNLTFVEIWELKRSSKL